MKRIAILIVLVTSTLVSMAQNKLGTWSVIPHVGVSISSLLGGSGIYEIGIEQGTEVKTHALLGFVGGADMMYRASDAVGLSVKVGIEPTCVFNANNHEVYQLYSVDKEGKKTNFQENTYDFDIKNGMHKFGLSIPVGVSYEYENVVLGALYHVGVFNIYKEGDSSRNSVFEVSVGYKLNL